MKKKLWMPLFVALSICLIFTSGVIAGSGNRQIQAEEAKNMFLTYNGEEFVARDANENVVYPLVVNGTSYLPVRSVCSIAGLKVKWDGNTRTINLMSSDYVPVETDGYIEETEINDTKADANNLPINEGKVKGRVGETLSQGLDKEDFYKFVVGEDGIVKIKIKADSESEMDAYILNTEDEELEIASSIPIEGILDMNMTLKPGTYYLNLRYDYCETPYKIDTTFVATPKDQEKYEENNPATFSLENGTIEIFGGTGTADDSGDFFKIKGFKGKTYDIDIVWTGPAMADCYVDFYDKDDYYAGERVQLELVNGRYKASGITESNIDNVRIYMVSDNDTTMCNEYTLTVKE